MRSGNSDSLHFAESQSQKKVKRQKRQEHGKGHVVERSES
jgi:hypothetical protein